ncbi:unnamed protein product [Durusdinium trenchii]|uniref:Pentatricopeptide repeat-containing protein n=1 Tax=Durusdinium trenchii TaxID=1381693 RepID=A0ABP0NK19_9DINO
MARTLERTRKAQRYPLPWLIHCKKANLSCLPSTIGCLRRLMSSSSDRLCLKDSVSGAASPVAVATRLILQKCQRPPRWALALHYLDEVSEVLVPDVVCFSAVIGICSKATVWPAGLQVLQQMQKVQVAPNLITYNSLVAASSRATQWHLAFRLIDEMKLQLLQPDQVTYNTSLVALRRAGLARQALRVRPWSDQAHADAYTYCAWISACSKTTQWAKALNLVEDAQKRELHLNKYVLSAAIAACGRGLQPRQALQLLLSDATASATNVSRDTVSRDAAVKACADGLLWAEAVSLLTSGGGPRAGVQSFLSAAWAISSASTSEHLSFKVMMAAQEKASRQLLQNPLSPGAWHDAVLVRRVGRPAESLIHLLRSETPSLVRVATKRGQLLRLLRGYVTSPVVAQLATGREVREGGHLRSDLLEEQYTFGRLCKELALDLGMAEDYPVSKLPWTPRRRPSRDFGVVSPMEPVAREMLVDLRFELQSPASTSGWLNGRQQVPYGG